jgi:hypothetical protein
MPVYCVLGMHRSGTSCLAGTLEEAGVHMGEVARAGFANARGDREDPAVLGLHKDLLRESGGTWHSPPRRVRWHERHRERRDEIIREREGRPSWGFKDPRTLLALEGWLEALPDLRLVGVLRHPAAVARSLERRDGFSLRKGLRLWTLYNERLLHHARERRFPVISFDLEPDPFREQLSRLLAAIELPRVDGLRFFDPGLRHEEGAGLSVPRSAATLHADLQALTI